jgi:hypothetical protein
MGEDMIPILIKAAQDSKGETIDIVMEHELPGITEEMYTWWGQNMHETRLYKMWHPDHIKFEIEKTDNPQYPIIMHPTEKIGKYGPSTMSFTGEPQSKFPFKPKYKNYGVGSHYSKDGLLLSYSYFEREEGPNGMKIREVHRWPAKTPKDLVDALVKHCTEEANNLPKFLPELYAKESKKTKGNK